MIYRYISEIHHTLIYIMTFTIFSITCLALVASALGCGVPAIKPQTIGSRIVNGQNAISGSWPWQVSLQLPNGFHFCGGSLINQNWVLTAAQCAVVAGYHRVILGEHNRGSNDEPIQIQLVSKVITHPRYNSATFNNDIALLKLSSPVTFTPRISPVCLAPSTINILPGTRCFTTGWGQTATTTSPEILQQTGVPIISPAVCRQLWGQSRITDTMICAGSSGSSSCQGDSGGPLVCERSGVWTLVGSVSWESSTCDPRFPAVYTCISQLRSWIDRTIRPREVQQSEPSPMEPPHKDWGPSSGLNCPAAYCSSGGSRMNFHNEHFLRHFPALRVREKALSDSHQCPHFGVVGWLDRAIGQLPVTEEGRARLGHNFRPGNLTLIQATQKKEAKWYLLGYELTGSDGMDLHNVSDLSDAVNDIKAREMIYRYISEIHHTLIYIMTFTIFSITCLALVASALGCGVPAIKPQTIGSRIVNGQNAISGSWPWQVSLQLPNGFHFCGGSLINQNWVLTAAQCAVVAGYHRVILGEHNRGSNDEPIQIQLVSKVITHPRYNSATFNNDIALLKLSSPVTFTPRISPVCLAPSTINILPGTRCFTTGWGQTATTTSPEILQQTGVPIISPAVCRQLWGQSRITDTMICAGSSGSSSCQGDSGGPLVCERSGVWTLVGSVSWESSTCDPRFPAVYTCISQLRSWIDRTIASN
ncbi:uncharacterized protein LOC131554222 [Onychostoma macrolepis]|uniref:uncharacterized protein LOC131554222 n=1 Tax=Onychostoma macrolepis TaxID=369639 RepID=UPI00272C759F|nr:uncharacterized protein LOC131554222 [Onychostoma macrolepis]